MLLLLVNIEDIVEEKGGNFVAVFSEKETQKNRKKEKKSQKK
jgi:hypothetical protein